MYAHLHIHCHIILLIFSPSIILPFLPFLPSTVMVRVRQALADPDFCRKLRGKIPKDAFNISDDLKGSTKYPTLLLKHLDSADGGGWNMSSYAKLGVITEHLLRLRRQEAVSVDALVRVSLRLFGVALPPNVLKAMTTERFLASVEETRIKVWALLRDGDALLFEPTVSVPGCGIEGHPDMATAASDQVFEVKTSGQLSKNWPQFLLQLFSYAALQPSAERVHLVLPLQAIVWTWDVKENWPKRQLFLDVLKSHGRPLPVVHAPAKKVAPSASRYVPPRQPVEDVMFQSRLMSEFPIGYHVKKEKSLRATLQGLDTRNRPYQIFFTNKAVAFKVSDDDIAQSAAFNEATPTQMYVHTPYLLNLCMEPGTEENYVVECLKKHLRVGAASGLKGVVVHVGKSVKMPLAEAMRNMRANLMAALEAATPECPLLLETPAGQGTETLTDFADFMEFSASVYAEVGARFGVCVDTCHVWAAGCLPLDYLEGVFGSSVYRPLLRLLHFNDSKTPQGSCVDRHVQLGMGYIPKRQFTDCAKLASAARVPMIIE